MDLSFIEENMKKLLPKFSYLSFLEYNILLFDFNLNIKEEGFNER